MPPLAAPLDAPLSPARITPEREIRTMVGLRPFRRSGFVVRAEALGAKTLVHNYGHGGCGVTLGWGTSQLAVEALDAASDAEAVAVIGAGVVGLATAVHLQRAGRQVTVYAAETTPETTSDIAGAVWGPFALYEDGAASTAFLAQFDRAARLAHAMFREQAEDAPSDWGVRWIRLYTLYETPPPQPTGLEADPVLYPGFAPDPLAAERFGLPHARAQHALMIDPDVHLAALTRTIEAAGGAIVRRRFESRAEIETLAERAVVNCTGLGAAALFGDEEIAPARGQMTLVAPPGPNEPEIDYGYRMRTKDGALLYMYPRRSGLLLGGTVEHGVWDTSIDPAERARVLTAHAAIADRLADL